MFKKSKSEKTLDLMEVGIVGLITFLISRISMLGVVKINLVKIIVKHLLHNITARR
jgi:hypothetical protein